MTAHLPRAFLPWIALAITSVVATATPANKAALEKHYDRFLAKGLGKCTTCHLPTEAKLPESLAEIPHNAFGHRLRLLGEEGEAAGKAKDLAARLAAVAQEDADGDGVANESELLLGHQPGEAKDFPKEPSQASARQAEFAAFLAGYRWQPFEPVRRPEMPSANISGNAIDALLQAERAARGLVPRPEAAREILLRRVYLDLIGLNPTPEEQRAFLADNSPDAYEKLIDRLLTDARHAERWARHWMDVWRYSDWAGWAGGNQIRDSKPHIWRWRDWIVEALQADKPYDRMVTEMLAADELVPEDAEALRATGFLVRNYKMLSREQWLEDTVKHTAQAFLGTTMGCAKCHDHMFDPITQREYYAFRAIFEPHQVRTDQIPGQLDTAKDGLPRAYDAAPAPTWFFTRGDERQPVKDKPIPPAVPAVFGGKLAVAEVKLPHGAVHPERRKFVVQETLTASEKTLAEAKAKFEAIRSSKEADKVREAELALAVADHQHAALQAVLEVETASGVQALAASSKAALLQRTAAVAEAKLKQHRARLSVAEAKGKTANAVAEAEKKQAEAEKKQAEAEKKQAEAEKELAKAVDALAKPLNGNFKPRSAETYPETSTGRRLALAQWIVDPRNPLTARVAVNHLWLRHFGRGLAPTPADFGRNGRPPTHPELLDWLAAEFMQPSTPGARPWSMRHLHRLILTSAAYRMASTPDEANSAKDPDNHYLWRMNSRRLEAEAVRDNLLYAAGSLDLARGGPDIDHQLALTSTRRSLYLRHAAEKQAEFLQIFDGPAVTECYERRPSVVPQQALALGNSEIAQREAKKLAEQLAKKTSDLEAFARLAFQRVLGREATTAEVEDSRAFLGQKPQRQASLVLVLFNHNEFVTIR